MFGLSKPRARRRSRPASLSPADIDRCVSLILNCDAVHVDSAEQAKTIVEVARKKGLDFEYEHTPHHHLYRHTVRNLILADPEKTTNSRREPVERSI